MHICVLCICRLNVVIQWKYLHGDRMCLRNFYAHDQLHSVSDSFFSLHVMTIYDKEICFLHKPVNEQKKYQIHSVNCVLMKRQTSKFSMEFNWIGLNEFKFYLVRHCEICLPSFLHLQNYQQPKVIVYIFRTKPLYLGISLCLHQAPAIKISN